ncbi:TonB-dependent receptor [Altererythrobacter sp. BO-6]|uniref:TonB-dependent receptor plug domain-containing protein n=1 Tax=Altererythrobacter sp. BO-6 TaxID=2604537 RepID=UPI0013E15E14|nr:TonB-dependent receptor [Altererythrobacter sp. BO-6]QIG54058.1 TonB-dependent receptor [Altererythrobacter sp. BO-6]
MSLRLAFQTSCAVSAFAISALATPAVAQNNPDQAGAESGEGEAIVVIGTRRTDRSVTDSASPIDVIGATELGAQPSINMLDTVRNIVPSFFVPQNTISDASTFVRPPSLRGLGADQILVMINGKRYNRAALVQVYSGADTALSYGSQGADISNIPAISVKNLQILRDGATAQYGSDAIGGVINYQIRDDAGFELQGLWGQTYEGDGDRKQIGGYAGFNLGDAGFISLSGEWYEDDGTSRGATRPTAINFATLNPTLVDTIPNYPGPAQIWGSSPGDGFKMFANAKYDFSDAAQLYATINYAESKANQSFNYRPSLSATGLVVDDGSGTPATRNNGRNGSFNTIYLTPCPANNATCPAGGFVQDTNVFLFSSIYPGGFTPRFIGEVEQLYGTAGLKGEFGGGLTYDLSATLARNSLSLSMTDSLSASFGPDSQTEFFFGDLIQREQTYNLDLTYPLEAGLASPITLSAGAEYRREEYEKTVGDTQSYAAGPYARQPLYSLVSPGVYAPVLGTNGQQVVASQSPAASGYGGVSPAFAGKSDQNSYGFYVGAETDVTDALTMGVAGRYEDYSTFGSAFVWKANALLELSDALSVRATIGTGFHAPSPGQNNTQIVTTNFRSGNAVQTGTYPVSSEIAQFYGAESLRPEKSNNYGAGFILKPFDDFTLTVDGYIIDVRNRIGISQTFTVTAADVTALPALAIAGVGGDVNYFTNGFDTSTKGIDAVASYRTDLAGGPLNLTMAYAFNKSKVTDFDPSVISAAQRFNIANLPPKHRLNTSANWQIGDFQVNARVNYFSSWANQLEYPGQRFGAKATADLDVSYTFMESFTLTVGANNLFDTYPDRIAASTTNPIYALTDSLADGQIYPRSGGPFGINGGFYYARLRIKY